MDKLQLYNLALSVFDLRIDDLQEPSKELRLLDLNYANAISFCLKAWEFPFLIKRVTLTDKRMEVVSDGEDVPERWGKFRYGYNVPEDFGYAVQVNANKKYEYAYRFKALWVNIGSPELEYMPNTIETDSNGNYLAPDEFMALVAYQLALHIAPMIDPDALAIAAQLYQLTFTSIQSAEIRNNDRPYNQGAAEPWGEDVVLTEQDVRDAIYRGDL